ncbi:MAG: hypothetical protein FWD24_04315 [Treponema sp.]|nr:hypothetical protein [Treponema sp.]
MNRTVYITGIFFAVFFIMTTSFINAQDTRQGSGMRSLAMNINARVMDEQNLLMDESQTRVAIPGSPVGVRLVGSNMVVVIQFTPFIRRQGNVLVAQGQMWINNPGGGVSYYTYIQTIPMDFNEPIYFFPLGTSNTSLQVILTVNPYIAVNDE